MTRPDQRHREQPVLFPGSVFIGSVPKRSFKATMPAKLERCPKCNGEAVIEPRAATAGAPCVAHCEGCKPESYIKITAPTPEQAATCWNSAVAMLRAVRERKEAGQ